MFTWKKVRNEGWLDEILLILYVVRGNGTESMRNIIDVLVGTITSMLYTVIELHWEHVLYNFNIIKAKKKLSIIIKNMYFDSCHSNLDSQITFTIS